MAKMGKIRNMEKKENMAKIDSIRKKEIEETCGNI
jgi:hypothetical protein